MVEVSNNFIQECEANVGTYKFGKIKVNYIDDNPFNYEQGAYSSSNGTKIDAEQSIRYNKLVECEPNFKYKIELGNSAYKMKIVTYNANQAFIAAHDNLAEGSELTTESTAAYISVTIYSNDTLEGTNITLNNTIRNGEISGAELKGNTTQDGTPAPSTPIEVNNVTGEQVVRVCGKNLYDKNNVTRTGASNQNIKFTTTLLPNTQYTFNITSNRTWGTIYLYDSSNTQTRTIGNYSDANKLTFTTSSSEVKGDFIFKADTNVDISTYDFTGVQLEKGSTATSYEPYQGKDYEINLGANILDIQNSWANSKKTTQNGLHYILNEDDTISISGTSTNYSGTYARNYNSTDVFMTLKANHKYRLLVEISNKTSNINSRVYFGKANENISDFSIPTMVGNGIYYKDYMPTEDVGLTQYSVIGAQSVGETSLTMKIAIYDVTTNTIDKYIKYFEPIELNKIGNYQDYIRKGTGKNLFDKDKEVENYFYNAVGVKELSNDTTFINQEYDNIDFTSIKMSFLQRVGTPYLRVCEYNSNGTFIKRTLLETNNQLLNFDNNTKKVIFSTNAEGFTNLQLEKGSSATSFEPYGCRGKNLYEGSQDFSGTWINESSWSTADETYNGLVVKYRKDAWNGIMKEIDVEKNGVYTFSFFGKKSASGATNVYLGGGVGATPSEASFNLTTEWQRFSITFVATTGGKLKARVENSNNDSNTYICGYQLEKNNTMTSYEPYVYSTLKDKWYIEKNVLKLVVPNAVTGTLQNNNKRFYVNGSNLGSNNILRNTTFSQTYGLYCDILGEVTAGQTWNGTQGISYDYNSSLDLGCMDFAINGLTTVTEYQNALKGKAIYAIANTPEYTLIENEELIEQLDAVNHAETQEGTTNITSSGILPAILDVTPNLIESIRGKQTTPIVGYNITGDDDLINFKITSKADSNGNILGATSQSQVDIEIFNENNTHNLENKQVYISTGLSETEGNYCKWQPFTITQTKDTQTKNHTTYTGYDDMMRGNEAYIDNVDYGEEGITLYDFTCKLAKEMGMALGNTTMTNGEFIVKGNNFTNNEAKLVVLKNVAQMAGGFAMIDRDNLLRIVELPPEDAMTPIELTTNLYTEDFQNSAKFGEINEFAIGETNIETNAIVRSDDTSIAKNGVKKIEILDNMFLGLLEDKEIAIEPLWDAFNGFSYYPFKTPYNGYPYIDLGDKINITDINSNVYSTLVLNNVFEYNGGYKGNIGAEALSITAAKYKTNNTLGKQFRKVGIEIDRVEGKITSEIAAATDGITQAYNTAISQTEKNINISVTAINNTISGNPKVEGDTGLAGLVQTINQNYLTVDSDGFKAVSSTATAAQEKADKVEKNTKKIVSQLHFDAETGLTISAEGSTDDDMKLNLTNSQVNFMYRNSPVLVINGNKIEFTGATFQKFDLGNYVWQAEDDDSLSLIYEGD